MGALTVLVEPDMIGITENRFEFCPLERNGDN